MTNPIENQKSSLGMKLAVTVAAAALIAWWIIPSASSDQDTFMVYKDIEHCEKAGGPQNPDLCQSMHEEAEAIAANMSWSFASVEQCVESYSEDSCLQDGESVRLKMAGFTQFSNTTRFGTILPVFHSTVHPGLYMPNAYPVLAGQNTIMTRLLERGAIAGARTRSLGEDMCIEHKGEQECGKVHTFVTGSLIDRAVVTSLFDSPAR